MKSDSVFFRFFFVLSAAVLFAPCAAAQDKEEWEEFP
jgi:hypothetical protein